jgi:hypothetical protein
VPDTGYGSVRGKGVEFPFAYSTMCSFFVFKLLWIASIP